ncbi:MAG TPA: helix-hairpin-helix domain-containing protein, partial [Labilithrix sp.]
PLPTGKDPSSARMRAAPPAPPQPAPNPKATTVAQPVVGPKPSPLASSLPPAASPEAMADAFAPTPLAPVVIVAEPVADAAKQRERSAPPPAPEKRPSEAPKRPSYIPPGMPSGFPGFDEGSIAFAFDALMSETPTGVGQLQNVDLTPVRELFAQLAASHMRHVRDFMLDVKWGEATGEWIEICVPACVSLRRASERLELADLTVGLDGFAVALEGARGTAVIEGDGKQRLLDAYGKLCEILPAAFSLDNDRSAREAVIVQSLLLQIPDVRKVTIDKLHAAGLTSLKTLWEATSAEIAQVSGIPAALAQTIIDRFQEYRRELRESRPSDARAAEREKLAALATQLKQHHDGYEEAARGWSADAKSKKRELFRAREETWLAISLLLARFGEVERLQGIEKVPFAQRIAQLEGWLDEAAEKYRLGP